MGNNYFKFKAFTVNQEDCAMKVCTDASLFGAWASKMMNKLNSSASEILDIGTGTGLLSLMVAQLNHARIDAVEINAEAATQAKMNFDSSPWSTRLSAIYSDILEFKATAEYDFIISNPPFYESSLKSPDESRNDAMHDTSLTLKMLLDVINNNLTIDGYAFILLPFPRTADFISAAFRMDLHVNEHVFVQQTPSHHFFRSMIMLSRIPSANEKETEISIRNADNEYTDQFKEILSGYYLAF